MADQLRHLYEHPDYVEMYPGIVAEEAKKPMVPGVGIVRMMHSDMLGVLLIVTAGPYIHYIESGAVGRGGVSSW